MGQYRVFDPSLIGRIWPTHSGRLRVVVGWNYGAYDERTTRFPKRAARWSRRAIQRQERRDERCRARLDAATKRDTP